MSKALVCFCTCPTVAVARSLATKMVEAKVAACVNLVPGITSIYRWQGAVCEDAEMLLLIKTTAEAYPALETLVRAEHPYELPELIAVSLDNGSTPYLSWLIESTKFF
jgi:periplasmic divalent cation tolerance protein